MIRQLTPLTIAALLAGGPALAAPNVVSDPTTRTDVTHCAWYLDGTPRQLVAAPKDATGNPYCKLDVAGVTNGAHTLAAAFVIQDATWGEQEGPKSDPFPFTRPAPPPKPSSLKVQ
jgi:hypothetical protein